MPTLWSGRFGSEPDRGAFEFGASFGFDRRLFEEDVAGSIAWAEALSTAGAIADKDAESIISGLGEILQRGRDDPTFVNGSDEDIHTFVERQLVERIGEPGKRLHTGRSRNEQVSVDLRLYLMRRIPLLQAALADLIDVLATQAEGAGDALMPAYTHLRPAQPVLVAHYFLAHIAAFRRDHSSFTVARGEADVLPLGSGAAAGTAYAIDTGKLAARLGFSRVVFNSLDAAGDRDFVTAFLYACAQAQIHLSRLAEDLILFTGEEFAFFTLADEIATGSSLLPQKKNPDPLELVRGKTGRVIGHLTGWLTTMKGVPSGYNKDLQEDKEALFAAEATVAASLEVTNTVVRTLSVNRARAMSACSGFLLATDVADYLVSRGMAFRQAHEVVGGIVRRLIADRRDFQSLTLADWRRHSDLFDEQIVDRLTAAASVAAKQTPQSTNPDAVQSALADVRRWLNGVRRV